MSSCIFELKTDPVETASKARLPATFDAIAEKDAGLYPLFLSVLPFKACVLQACRRFC